MLGMASGIFIVPILTMFGGVNMHTAIAASIVPEGLTSTLRLRSTYPGQAEGATGQEIAYQVQRVPRFTLFEAILTPLLLDPSRSGLAGLVSAVILLGFVIGLSMTTKDSPERNRSGLSQTTE